MLVIKLDALSDEELERWIKDNLVEILASPSVSVVALLETLECRDRYWVLRALRLLSEHARSDRDLAQQFMDLSVRMAKTPGWIGDEGLCARLSNDPRLDAWQAKFDKECGREPRNPPEEEA